MLFNFGRANLAYLTGRFGFPRFQQLCLRNNKTFTQQVVLFKRWEKEIDHPPPFLLSCLLYFCFIFTWVPLILWEGIPPHIFVNSLQPLTWIRISWVHISAKTPTLFTGFLIFFIPSSHMSRFSHDHFRFPFSLLFSHTKILEYSMCHTTCHLNSLKLYTAAVCKAWSLLGSPRNSQAMLYLFQKHLLYLEYIGCFSQCGHFWNGYMPIRVQWWPSYKLVFFILVPKAVSNLVTLYFMS